MGKRLIHQRRGRGTPAHRVASHRFKDKIQYRTYDDLEKEGKECVMFILDYLNRIRPSSVRKTGEERFALSDISNELSTIAKVKQIPVITATQMNREAFRLLEDAQTYEEKVAAAGRMGASQIGEAIAIVQNVDMAIILNRITNSVKNAAGQVEYEDKYLMLNCVASRGNSPSINKFQIRFANGNDLRLMEDYNLDKSLATFSTEENIAERMNRSNGISRPIRKVN